MDNIVLSQLKESFYREEEKVKIQQKKKKNCFGKQKVSKHGKKLFLI